MDKPYFSIIMPIYNVQSYLEKSINSVLSQNFENFELILVDDGSEDKSCEIMLKYSKKDKRVKTIYQENSGVSVARNMGLKMAVGDYIYFMDPDDWIEQGLLSNAYKILHSFRVQMYVFGHNSLIDDFIVNKSSLNAGLIKNGNLKSQVKLMILHNKMGTVWDKIFKRELLIENKVSFPIWSNAQDGGFIFEALRYIETAYFDGKIYYNFLMQRTGSTTSTFKPDILNNCIKKINRFHKLIKDLGIDNMGMFEKMYIEEILNFAIYENITNTGSPKCVLEKKKYIIESLEKADFYKFTINNTFSKNLISFPIRIIYFLTKHHMILVALLFFCIKVKIKKLLLYRKVESSYKL